MPEQTAVIEQPQQAKLDIAPAKQKPQVAVVIEKLEKVEEQSGSRAVFENLIKDDVNEEAVSDSSDAAASEKEHQTQKREFLYHGTDQEVKGDPQAGPMDWNIGGKAFYLSPDPDYANDYTTMMIGREGHSNQHDATPNMLRMELKPGTRLLNLNDAPSEELVEILFQYANNKNPELFEGEDLGGRIDQEMGRIEDWDKEQYRFDKLIDQLGISYDGDRKLFTDLGYSGIRITRSHLGPRLLSEVAVWDNAQLKNAMSADPIPPLGPDEGITQESQDLLKAIDQKRGDPSGFSLLRMCNESGVEVPQEIEDAQKRNYFQESEINALVELLRKKQSSANTEVSLSQAA